MFRALSNKLVTSQVSASAPPGRPARRSWLPLAWEDVDSELDRQKWLA